MNTRISFSQVVEGFVLSLNARHLSQHTIADYLNTYRKFQIYLDEDPPIADITSNQVQAFLVVQTVSKKAILNCRVGLSSMWTWALSEGQVKEHIIRKIPRPKSEKKAINPYAEADIKSMLSALTHSCSYIRRGKRESKHRLLHADRHRAIRLLLLDTGMPFSARTGQVLWRYLATRKEVLAGDSLFVTTTESPLKRTRLLNILIAIGERARVDNVNSHRFRHTFGRPFGRLVNAS